ncbi:hypothetical protein GCM10007103_35360 [Salinimicrobium marinum]|uniref:Uncharacterized protein n=1 Tax=Salinimicrobium marinum TaxID=680283 RepID=A0A918SKX4_9FLAO|nr:hypothetical protein [Salinimicrobium marinum]GHA51849.1 hypothetical protein GCM10007103_35360 [Salinimicrobium marinum]
MEIETIIWGNIPILIGLLEITGSVYLTVKMKNIIGFILSFLILGSSGFAIIVLINIIGGAYPTFLPHILISISAVLLLLQRLSMNKNKTFANNI